MSIYRTDLPNGHISNLEAEMLSVIKAWCAANPAQLILLEKQAKMMRERGRHTTEGLSADKTMLHKGEIPTGLYWAIQRKFMPGKDGNDWIMEPRLRNMFWSMFKVGLVNRRSIA